MDNKQIKVMDIAADLEAAGLLSGTSPDLAGPAGEAAVSGLTYDSREVSPGTAFVCKGTHFKKEFLRDSVGAGASCYITEIPYGLGSDSCPELLVTDIRAAMPVIAGTFYGDLSGKLGMIGITGTKGKSTTTYYMRYILDDWLEAAGEGKSAVCSGIYNYDGVIDEESHLTTPEILELYTHMDNALKSGIHYLSMEVSSQGLRYNRLDGITFRAGAFLNIGRDHISPIEHPDFEDYFGAKLLLFRHCKKACYNLDCDGQEELRKASEDCPYVITFSQKDPSANVYGYDVKSESGKVSLRMRIRDVEGYPDIDEEVVLGTFGTINVENALAAASLSALMGVPFVHVQKGLEKSSSPGRMEVFRSADGKRIAIVDYAHNKLSYESFFETIGEEFPGKKIMIVFGCPGGKAFERRVELGTIAGKNCCHSIITEEDYGEEDVNKICEEIAVHVAAAGGSYEIITDRVEAIKKAISLMDDDTILFLPGKGRETREKRGILYIDTPSDADVVMEYMK